MIILLILVITLGIFYYDSNTRIVTNEYELNFNDLPSEFDGFRIVVLSDIHGAEFGKNNERLISNTIDANPDIIVITGDFIDRFDTTPIEMQLSRADILAERLVQIAPVYYITGNHDWDSRELPALKGILEKHGVTILQNQFVLLERDSQSIILAGTDDPNGRADMIMPTEFVERIRETHPDAFLIMLEHRNYNLPLYSALGVDLVISGHAHGGIIRLPFTDGLIGPMREFLPSHTSGVQSLGSTKMLVSRGLGSPFAWMRLFNNPEIAVAVLRSE